MSATRENIVESLNALEEKITNCSSPEMSKKLLKEKQSLLKQLNSVNAALTEGTSILKG